MKAERIITYGAIAALIIILFLQRCGNQKTKELLSLQQQVLNDSLIITKDKLGESTATINNIQADADEFKRLQFLERDSLARQLQRMVNRRTQSAGIATIQLHIDTVLSTDEVYFDIEDTCHPVYIKNFNEPFQQGFIKAGADSFHINLRYPERLTWNTEWSKWRLFKKQESVSTLKNENPYVDITGFRTFSVKCDCSKKSWIAFAFGHVPGALIGFGAGYGYAKLK